MKAINRNKITMIVALMLVLSLTVGLTMAYFSARAEAKGGVKVALGGQTVINEVPGDGQKVITIENTGETDVLVRVAVYAPTEVTYSGSSWEDGGDGYWYYKSVLPAGKTSDSLTAKWVVPENIAGDYNVVITQESEMAVYDKDGKIVKPTTTPTWANKGPVAN